MAIDWKSIVGAVAPALATALGGPLAGAAVSAIGGQLLGNDAASESEVAAVVAAGKPEMLARLKEIDAEFKVKMEQLGIDLEQINQADRASARQREIEVRDWTPRALAGLVTIGFFGILAWIIGYGLPNSGHDAILVLLGALGSAWTSIVAYYYGSSSGSAQKTTLIGKLGLK